MFAKRDDQWYYSMLRLEIIVIDPMTCNLTINFVITNIPRVSSGKQLF